MYLNNMSITYIHIDKLIDELQLFKNQQSIH